MAGAGSVAAVLLASVFAWAGVAKLARRSVTAAAFADLALPAPRALAVVVPLAELTVAAVLVARPDVGGALALAALAAFTLVIVRALTAGSTAGCGCFGSPRLEPVSPADVIRNALLAGFAAVATATPHLVRPGGVAIAGCAAGLVVAASVQTIAQRHLGRARA